jgi:carbonic anhydrase
MKHRVKLQTAAALALAALIGAAGATSRLCQTQTVLADQAAATAKGKQSLSPEAALERLKAGNNRFVDEKLEKKNLGAQRRKELAGGQKPFAVVLTCADSRLTPEFIFDQGLGDIFVLRVAGNVVDPIELGSIEFAVEHLHVPLIVLLGHEKCGAVEAALEEKKPAGNLGELVRLIGVGKDLPSGKDALGAAIKNNVRHQTRLLTERSQVLKEHVVKKEVRIVSGVYQLESGKIDWLEEK